VAAVGVDHVGEQPQDARIRLTVVQHLLDGVAEALAGVVHLLEQVTPRLARGPLVAQLGELLGETGLSVAQGGGRPVVGFELRVETGDALPGLLASLPGRRGRLDAAVVLLAELIRPALEALRLLLELGTARREGLEPTLEVRSLPGGPLDALAGLLQTLAGIHLLLLEPRTLLAEAGDLPLGVGDALRRRGDVAAGGLQPLPERLDRAAERLDPLAILLDVLARFGEVPLGQLAPLLGVLAGGDQLQLVLLPLAERLLQVVPLDVGGLLGILELGQLGGELVPAGLEGLGGRRQPGQLLAQLVVRLERDGRPQLAEPPFELTVSPGLGGLALDDLEPSLGAGQLLADADEVDLRPLELPLRLDLPRLEAGDARRLLEDRPPLDGVGGQHAVHAALLDDRVGVGADAGVEEQLLDVLEPALPAVDQVLAAAVAVQAPGDVDRLGVVVQQTPRRLVRLGGVLDGVVEGQRDRRRPDGLPGSRAGEDDVHHRVAAKALGGALPEHPLDRVDDVRLAAAVGADDARDRGVELELGGIRERFEARDGDLSKPHAALTSCRASAHSLGRHG
jgi:hypothetical protein